MNTECWRMAVVVLLVAGLGACGGVSQGTVFERDFWTSGPMFSGDGEAELGIAALAKGDYGIAEAHFMKALSRDRNNVHALLGSAILYQHTGRITKAREMYEAVLALRPPQSQQLVVMNNLTPKPVAEIASVNLALLDSGGVLRSLGADPNTMGYTNAMGADEFRAPVVRPVAPVPLPGQAGALATPVPPVAPVQLSASPRGTAMLGRQAPVAAMSASAGPNGGQSDDVPRPRFADADNNIVSRFKTMKALLAQGLITQEEYDNRRRANVGALLPLTTPPSAAGLDRPVPSTEQVSGRLRAIGRALEMRAMTVGQHSSERSMILDALMPAAPIQVANPPPPPQGLMEAADAVRRLEMLKSAGYITTEEYGRERSAVEAVLQPKPMAAPKPKVDQSEQIAEPAANEMAMSGPQPGIHLASYRSQQAADRGWAQLRRAHRRLLADLKVEITRVNLGPGKGVFYRLKAGPLKSQGDAENLCRQLKRGRQFCEPTIMGAG